jgi:hypothetical protein
MTRLPYLLPWIRVLLLIRSLTSTTWGHEAWPQVKPLLPRALEMRRQIAREGWCTRCGKDYALDTPFAPYR